MVRTNICALRAVHRFKEAAARITIEDPPPDGFELGPRSLQLLVQEQQFSVLQKIGGVEGVAKLIHADLYYGIIDDPKDLQSRKKAFGENSYPRKSPKKILDFIWEACQDTTLIILEICAVISLITGMTSPKEGVKKGWYDGASIGFAVVLIILVTAFSDYKQSLEFRNLNKEKGNIQIQVTRGGRRQKVSIFSLVVGDIVPLAIGDQIPADGIIVSGYSILVDESSMTGESEPTHKDIKHPFLLSGCKVVDGHGIMLVTGVGMHTEWGNIMASFSEDTGKETPLQVRLNGTATFIGKVGLAVATIVFIVLFVRYFSIGYKYGTPAGEVISRLANIFSIAVVIVVIAVPEGLPLAVTLTLAYSMRKMMNDKSLVRHLSACETMGSATIICSDKTGTLTLNQMTVLKAWVSGKMWEDGVSRDLCYNSLNLLLEGIVQNSTGSVYSSKEGVYPEVSGSPTEKAILSWGLEIGMKFEDVKRKASIFKVEAFNSERKRAGVAIMLENGDIHVHWKGAAEIILNLCDKQLNTDGSISQIDGEEGKKLLSVINGMASESLRCIALAFDVVKKEDVPLEEEQLASWKLPDARLTFLAILGIKDPCRPGVLEAIRTCQAAGVKVLMVTGDNLLTAKAIARDCGILSDGIAIEGIEFRNYNSQEIMDCLPNLQVLARSLPTDKLLLVKKLKEFDEVVAVTGDGANDAAALCEADVGLSMGISGTEVAKESSDIIILDDNFGSVVKVVRWGRSVYFNIQKFIQFQLTINVAALGLNFVAALSEGDVPLNTVQMLWVNLIMDTLGALALATEPPTDTLMQRKPVGWSDPLVTNKMWRDLLGQAGYQLAVLLALYYKGEKIFKLSGFQEKKLKERNTIIFNTFVLCQVFNEINARKPDIFNIFERIFTNQLFIGVMTITIIIQVFIVEFLNNFAQTTKLSWQQWCSCIIIGFFSLPLAFLLKCIPVPKRLVIRTHKLKYKYKRSNQVDQTIKSASEAPTGPTLTGVQGVTLSHQQHHSPLRSSKISETVSEINLC